ncbi:MAG: hypothetical protein WC658_03215 [Candidatus Omnitrophota bacterium]
MHWPKIKFLGYLFFLIVNSISFVVDVLMGEGGSGKIYESLRLPILILSGALLFIETFRYLFKKFLRGNKIIVAVASIFLTLLQVIILPFIFFVFAMYVLAPILGWSGFYVTMP